MSKLQRILAIILIAQLAVAVIVFWPRPSADGAMKLLLSEIKAEDITSLTIQDDTGVTLRLVKGGDGAWALPDAGDYPVDATKLTPVLTKLAELKVDRPVTQTPASHQQLQVADDAFQRRLEIGAAGGASRTLFVGSGAGGQSAHVRISGQNEVYLASNLAVWELYTAPASWINTAYLKLAPADLLGFTLANANGQWNFTRDAQGVWSLDDLAAGEQLDASKVDAVVNQASALNLTRPLGKEDHAAYGLAQPTALLTLKIKNGDVSKTLTLAVGAQDTADSSYVVKSSESPYYVRVAEFSVKELVEMTRAGFLLAPPTPAAPEAAPTP